jgi:hypothetical protein
MRYALIRLANPWRWAACASPRLGYVLGLVHFVTVTNLSRITNCWNPGRSATLTRVNGLGSMTKLFSLRIDDFWRSHR